MKRPEIGGMQYIAIGFACLIIATAVQRTVGLADLGPGVAGAILLSILVASVNRPKQPSDA